MTRLGSIKPLGFLSLFFLSVVATNFAHCLVDFRNGTIADGGVDYNGRPVTNPKDAVGLTYERCKLCGSGQEPFNWSIFSQQFSAWLLPWLALISQLPFGAEDSLDNLISVVLTVGSPTLAAFSLALTAANTHWAYNRFSAIDYPNRRNAVKALVHLQQVPLRLTTRDGLLASLIVLPQNDHWWECLVDRLEQTHTWTIGAATSIAWVVIAFAFTLADSFRNLGQNLGSDGRGVGTLWSWLIPIVVGWLWIPVCSYDKLKTAIDKANDIAFVAARDRLPQIDGPPDIDPPRLAYDISHMQGIRMYNDKQVFTKDAARAAPVFNYSRFWEWSSAVEMIARAFECAFEHTGNHVPVNRQREWVPSGARRHEVHRDNRIGTITQVQAYCGFPVHGNEEPMQSVPSGMWKRIFMALVFALGLQWGTTGSAVIVVLFTPTTGLGCRSGSYVIYGSVSTMILVAMLLSSYLAHYAKERQGDGITPDCWFSSTALAKGLATFLRRMSIVAAGCNSLFIILAGVFQFSNFYDTCYCNSSVLGRGSRHAYSTIAPSNNYQPMEGAWIRGVFLAGGCTALFLSFLYLMLEPPHDTENC